MFLTEQKLHERIKQLSDYRYRDRQSLAPIRFKLEANATVGMKPSEGGEWSTIATGHRWEGRDVYAWLALDFEIPAQWEGKNVVGLFDFGQTGGGHNSGFEALLYLDGVPYQGVDTNHQEVFFPEQSIGTGLSLRFLIWSGLEGMAIGKKMEHEIKRAELVWLDEAVDDLYFTAKTALETVEELGEHQPERIELLKAIDRAFLALDWSHPGSDVFYASVEEARSILRNELKSMPKNHPVTVNCIGHTHIDVVWLWQLKHTREKCARSFSTVLRLMEKYPDYTFLQTQPQLYEYIKNDYPEIYEQIKQRVKEGRWEADGGMWLEADCNLPSGESLVRQLLYGTRFLREEFGTECKYLWLPDVFGYSWALPQILLKSGIKTFMTTKISWNQYNRMPHDTFKWRGMDGSELLTHFITTPELKMLHLPRYTYNGKMKPIEMTRIWNAYRDKNINQELLLAYGHGDGGGGVNREMLETRRRMDEMPGLPQVKTGRADDFFEQLHETVKDTDQYVHTWDGELYLEYHRGTYTSQAYHKRMNRKLELLYRETEWLNVLASTIQSTDYPEQNLREGWKIILRNQFHDAIPGSSIHEVYEDSRIEYAEAEDKGLKTWNHAAKTLTEDHQSAFTIFNAASWQRTDLLAIPVRTGMEVGKWIDGHGDELYSQQFDDHWIVYAKQIPSMGYQSITFDSSSPSIEVKSPFEILYGDGGNGKELTGIITPHYQIQWNEQGQLTSIVDQSSERQVLAQGEYGNVLQVFEDKPEKFDAWDIDIFYQEKKLEISELDSVQLISSGPLQAVIQFKWRYANSTIIQNMILYKESCRIDFQTKVDWQERQQLVKVAFPVDIRSTEATYDVQFGNVKRPTHWNTSWDMARFETVGHQWADLSERGYGVSLLNDCKYGYDIKDHVMRLTLIKSAINPDLTADQGEHIFTYALLPHQGDWLEGNTVREAWMLNNPLTHRSGKPAAADQLSLFQVNHPNVMIDAVKKSEEGKRIVVRLHEFAGSRGNVSLQSDLLIEGWQECDLMERPTGDLVNHDKIQFQIKPYEIITLLIDVRS
jgi:alpha-mannosidase